MLRGGGGGGEEGGDSGRGRRVGEMDRMRGGRWRGRDEEKGREEGGGRRRERGR